MKKNILRLISIVLVLASLVSVFSVSILAAADNTVSATAEKAEDPNAGLRFDANESLFINRTFDDGWDPFNGSSNDATMMGSHSVTIDKEVMSNLKYNYFVRFEQGAGTTAALLNYSLGARIAKENITVLSLSIKADDACDVGTIVKATAGDNQSRSILVIKGDTLYGYDLSQPLANLGDGEWVNLDIIFDWTDNNYYTSYIYVNGSSVYTAYTQETWLNNVKNAGLKSVAIGFHTPTSGNDGMGFCIDNVQLYQDVHAKYDVSDLGYGMNINKMLEKTIPIYTGEGDLTPEAALANSLAMKLGISSALFKNTKISIDEYIAPVMVDDKVMVPLELIIKYLGYPSYIHPDGASYSITTTSGDTTYITLGRDNAKVNGEIVDLVVKPASIKNANGKDVAVIAIDDIETLFPGFDLVFDDMGLIVMHPTVVISGEHQTILSREKNLGEMLNLMKKFVFDTVEYDENGKALEEADAYVATGEAIYAAVAKKTNGFQHPYLLVSGQSEFDELRENVESGNNATLSAYATGFIAKMDAYYDAAVATRDEVSGKVTFKDGMAPVNVYMDNVWPDPNRPEIPVEADSDDGYNPNNHALYELEEFTADLLNLAFAYQLTGDDKYLDLAYAMADTIADWTHWAPGFFVNCATGAANFAIAYDWLYNAWVERFGIEAVDALADALYEKALYHGFNSISGEFCKFPRGEGYGDRFTDRTDSWNAIGASGMIIGAMAIMDRVVVDGAVTAEGELINYVVGGSFVNFAKHGLDQYAPDGSYIDSVTYWAKGTNAIMQLIAALNSAAGTDLGITNSWGLYDTFYYACHFESSDGNAWNYHEDGLGSIIHADYLTVDTSIFNLAATLLGDENLYAIRLNQVNKGKAVSLIDILYYPTGEFNQTPELELDYYMEGIDAFISRSDWENGALYVGIMGGDNVYTPYVDGEGDEIYGQLDSGNFVYYNKGIQWIIDMGSDNHYAYQYFGASRFKYYRNSAEGHNVVIITSEPTDLPYGQHNGGSGDMYAHYTAADGSGSYAIINNTTVYNGVAAAAYRGMMLTDNRETVVIQDEVALNGISDIAWVVHTAQKIELANEGKTAFLTNTDATGKKTIIRATIVSTYDEFKFSVLEGNTQMLNATNRHSAEQFNRSNVKRLAIVAKGAISLNVAVVFDQVTNVFSADEPTYKWTGLHAWKSLFEEEQVDDGRINRGTPDRNTIINQADLANAYYNDETAFTSDFYNFYVALADVAFTLRTYPEESFGSLANASDPSSMVLYNQLMLAMAIYRDLVDTYEEYAELINDSVEQNHQFSRILAGE